MSIKSKIIFSFLVFIFIPVILAGSLNYVLVKRELIKQIKDKLALAASVQEKRVDEVLKRYQGISKGILAHISIHINLTEYLSDALSAKKRERAEDGLKEVAATFSEEMMGAMIMGEKGTFLTVLSQPPAANDYSVEVFLRDKLREQIVINKSGDTAMLDYYLPVIQDGQFLGAFLAVFKLDAIAAVTGDYVGLGQTGETVLAFRNQAGDAEYFTPRRFAGARTIVKKEEINVPIIQALSKNEAVLMDYIDYRGEPVIAVTKYIDLADWGLAVKEDKSEAFAPIAAIARLYFMLIILLICVSGMIIWLMTRTIYNPLIKLKVAADTISRGNFDVAISRDVVSKKDELGLLARSFQEMETRLKALYGSLNEQVAKKTEELSNKVAETRKINQNLTDAQTAMLNVMDDLAVERDNLAEAKKKNEAILASIGDGMFATDKNGIIIAINKAGERMLGWKAGEVVGKLIYNIIPMENESGQLLPPKKRPIWLAINKNMVVHSSAEKPYYFVRKDGMKFAAAITVTPIKINSHVSGAVNIFRDITKEREIDRSKTEFVSLASHQLRTPLTAIKWYMEMLLEGGAGKLSKEQIDYVNEAYNSNSRMIELVNALLNVSRIEMGIFSVEPEVSDIFKMTEEMVEDIEPEIKKRNLQFSKKYDKAVGKIMLDRSLIRIVMQNLLSNAVRYTPSDGKVSLIVKKQGEKVLFTVSDTGIGIPREQQDKIFQKFFRADNARKQDTSGTGLGLYIVKAIVEKSGGKIWFESQEGKGSVFYVQVPILGMKKIKAKTKLV